VALLCTLRYVRSTETKVRPGTPEMDIVLRTDSRVPREKVVIEGIPISYGKIRAQ
jgi:hypothetical protein